MNQEMERITISGSCVRKWFCWDASKKEIVFRVTISALTRSTTIALASPDVVSTEWVNSIISLPKVTEARKV